MSLPLNHASERAKLIAQQLFAEYPNASPELIRAAATTAERFEPRDTPNVIQIATWRDK